jgi:glycosyltransferase involved in cell wall biosynthesis
MKLGGAVPLNPNWAVPAADANVFAPKQHRYALVIPILNEGDRIRTELRRIATEVPAADVVIADGGSTDNSLDEAFLRSANVNTLLTKRGPGRLSAQLRMGYAYALARGYDGVITVDGNDKDDTKAVQDFIDALDRGYDFVQGSRYLPGGTAENTPMERYLAGRLIHAPLTSIAAGYRFTDTTNGFRAYSRRALSDPRVAPFRDVFQDYELLFYLSVRMPRLGYRVTELPVSRRYPSDGPTPTKIAGVAAKAAMMGQLLRAVTGALNP